MTNFLISFHVPANTGYAIEPLETAFFEAVSGLISPGGRVHLSYTGYPTGPPHWLPNENIPVITMKYGGQSREELQALTEYLQKERIRHVFAFDLAVNSSICETLRRSGVQTIVSYWGAPMSSVNRGLKLLAKRAEVLLLRNKPDHFIFESYGMQRTATHGRGIDKKDTSVIRLGISLDEFSREADPSYVFRELSIPADRRVFFYAGHMEERKGVHVIIKAAAELVNLRSVRDAHFVICGNKNGEEEVFSPLFRGTKAEEFITFAGYRNDIPSILPGCYAGIIASTGWDSFPRTSLEMTGAGLPLLVSDMIGLNETVVDQETGLLFPRGDHSQLADRIEFLLENPEVRDRLGEGARERVRREFTRERQIRQLQDTIQSQIHRLS